MPVRLTDNVDLKQSHGEDNRVSRKKCRLSVYLTSATKGKETRDDVNIFNETDVQNVLESQIERKRSLKQTADKKLKLVWKGTYNQAKTLQESLDEMLIQQRKAPKKLRFTSRLCRRAICTKSKDSLRFSIAVTESNKTGSIESPDATAMNDWFENDNLELGSYKSYRSLNRISSKTVYSDTTAKPVDFPIIDSYLLSLSEGSSSIRQDSFREITKKVFKSKRAHNHQVQNLFCYRFETPGKPIKKKKLKVPPTSVGTIDRVKEALMIKERCIPELKDKVEVNTLLRAYLSEEFLNLRLEGEEARYLRQLYESAILHQPIIHNLFMKHPNMLPAEIFADLVTFKMGFEVHPMYASIISRVEEGHWRETLINTLSLPAGNTLIELENDVPQYANFYKKLMELRAQAIKVDKYWIREKRSHVLREKLIHVSVALRIGRLSPGSTVRFDLMQLFEAAKRNRRLLQQLGLSVDGWLNQLVLGLQSSFKSVREETCQVLCYMTSSYSIMKELYMSRYFDVVRDICLVVLRVMDQFEEDFPECYIVLAHFIHYCPSSSIIENILDRWNSFRCTALILKWPRLMYYALRYWPTDPLCFGSRVLNLRIIRALETALQRPYTAKVARFPLFFAQARFLQVSRFFTINYCKQSVQRHVIGKRGHRRG